MSRGSLAFRIVGVAVAYVVAARLGLTLDAVAGFATLVWPASGIALAALLLGGYRLWPAIAIGAFVANALNGAAPLTALGIAAGNTAEALLGAFLLNRYPGFRNSLERVRDVVALMIFAAGISTTVSATAGVTTLLLSGIVTPDSFIETWRAWWLGDAIGDLLFAPVILIWADWRPLRLSQTRALEAVVLAMMIIAATLVVFGIPGTDGGGTSGREYLLFPPLIWAALRFGTRGAVTASVSVMAIAVAETALGRGPFVRPELYQSLVALQAFLGITGATFLVLGASIAERRRTEHELRAARETAETANRAKAGFLAMVSHELRTPLNAITGYLDLLDLEVDGPLTSKQRASIDRIVQSQRHLLSLIEDVLGFAQVEAGRLSFTIRPIRVRQAFDSIEPIVGAELKRKNLTLEIGAVDDELYVNADADKLRQVILNLVANAMKFTAAGGKITMSARSDGDRARIDVADSGIGIPARHVKQVFEPFFQVEQGDTRRYPGLGIGLSIVRNAVLAMDGEVGIESVEGKGTTAFILLPVSRPAPVAAPQETIGHVPSVQPSSFQ
jgi:signal transduction histidine kinase